MDESQRVISIPQLKHWDDGRCPSFVCSAKTGAGVKELFQTIAVKEYEIMKDK